MTSVAICRFGGSPLPSGRGRSAQHGAEHRVAARASALPSSLISSSSPFADPLNPLIPNTFPQYESSSATSLFNRLDPSPNTSCARLIASICCTTANFVSLSSRTACAGGARSARVHARDFAGMEAVDSLGGRTYGWGWVGMRERQSSAILLSSFHACLERAWSAGYRVCAVSRHNLP